MNWMPEARQVAAQCWCDDDTSHIVMEPALAEAFARRVSAWMESAAQFSRDAAFYRDLVDRCAACLGVQAYTDDAGTVHDTPIRLKVPELVAKQLNDLTNLKD